MNKHIGSTLESLLDDLGERDETELLANKKIVAEILQRRMTTLGMTAPELATRMKTSRNQVHRLLDPQETGITFRSLDRASRALGLTFAVRLVPRPSIPRTSSTASPRAGESRRAPRITQRTGATGARMDRSR
jgi:antitoxin HicB